MERSTPVDGFSLAYERHGRNARTPVVLLHGWPGDRDDWRTVTATLGDAFDVIACDLRGFGQSDAHDREPADAYGPEPQARSVLGLIDELDLAPVVLAGYDVGAQAEFWYQPFHRLAERYSAPGAFTASIAWYRAGAGTVAASLAERSPAPEDRLAVPTTVLWPEHDPLFPRQWSDRVEEFFSDATLRALDGVGHFIALEGPDAVAAAIRAAAGA